MQYQSSPKPTRDPSTDAADYSDRLEREDIEARDALRRAVESEIDWRSDPIYSGDMVREIFEPLVVGSYGQRAFKNAINKLEQQIVEREVTYRREVLHQ